MVSLRKQAYSTSMNQLCLRKRAQCCKYAFINHSNPELWIVLVLGLKVIRNAEHISKTYTAKPRT